MGERITKIDGTVEEQTTEVKKFFGLSSEQSFQELEVDEEESQ